MQIDLFQGKTGRWVFLSALSVLSPGGIVAASSHKPLKNCLLDSLLDKLDTATKVRTLKFS